MIFVLSFIGILSNTSLIGDMAAAEDAKRYNECDCCSINHNCARALCEGSFSNPCLISVQKVIYIRLDS